MFKSMVFVLFMSSVALAQENAGLSVEPSAGNVAALFTMTDEGGRLRNLQLMESVFKDGSLGFSVESHHNVSSPFIYERLKTLAGSIPEGATLLVYLNSHGGGSGNRFIMTAQGGNFKFSKALDAMKSSGKMVRRLIILVDTCHAEGSIQDSTGEDGELLKNLQVANPTAFLPELPSAYSREAMPFLGPFVTFVPTDRKFGSGFVTKPVVDFGEDSGVWEELLIVSSSSVEDLSVRGVFASRLAVTFKSVKGDSGVTVGEFLKRFAQSHGTSGQQPHFKVLPDASIFDELLFGPWFAQTIPIRNHAGGDTSPDFIPVPRAR
jgi:hypothetical protein